jgi:hypothetical protein
MDRDKYFATYLAIRDKATGKTRLVEARHALLKPVVRPSKLPKIIFPLVENGIHHTSTFTLDAPC